MKLLVKNWRDFQHYDKRRPPWIKLHRGLLDDYEYQSMPVASRALAPMLWLLASDSDDGAIDYDKKKLAFRLRLSEKELVDALNPLIEHGFFLCKQSASTPLASEQVSAYLETEGETETETEKRLLVTSSAEDADPERAVVDKSPKPPPCPYDEILTAYHEVLPTLPRVVVLTDKRRAHLQARWRQVWESERFDQAGGVALFRGYFERVASSKFLTGRTAGSGNRKPFVADLAWLVNPENFAKVLEGKYA